MPHYRGADVDIRLTTSPVANTTNRFISTANDRHVRGNTQRVQAALSIGQRLFEEDVPCLDDDYRTHYLGGTPFLFVKARPPQRARDRVEEGAPTSSRFVSSEPQTKEKAANENVESPSGQRASSSSTRPGSTLSEDSINVYEGVFTNGGDGDYTSDGNTRERAIPEHEALQVEVTFGARSLRNRVTYDELLNERWVGVKVDVFVNGELCSSNFNIPRTAPWVPAPKMTFAGRRYARLAERALLLANSHSRSGHVAQRRSDFPGDERRAFARWRLISNALFKQANAYGRTYTGARPPVGEYLENLATMNHPPDIKEWQTLNGQLFGIIDVVVTLGDGTKDILPRENVLKPTRPRNPSVDPETLTEDAIASQNALVGAFDELALAYDVQQPPPAPPPQVLQAELSKPSESFTPAIAEKDESSPPPETPTAAPLARDTESAKPQSQEPTLPEIPSTSKLSAVAIPVSATEQALPIVKVPLAHSFTSASIFQPIKRITMALGERIPFLDRALSRSKPPVPNVFMPPPVSKRLTRRASQPSPLSPSKRAGRSPLLNKHSMLLPSTTTPPASPSAHIDLSWATQDFLDRNRAFIDTATVPPTEQNSPTAPPFATFMSQSGLVESPIEINASLKDTPIIAGQPADSSTRSNEVSSSNAGRSRKPDKSIRRTLLNELKRLEMPEEPSIKARYSESKSTLLVKQPPGNGVLRRTRSGLTSSEAQTPTTKKSEEHGPLKATLTTKEQFLDDDQPRIQKRRERDRKKGRSSLPDTFSKSKTKKGQRNSMPNNLNPSARKRTADESPLLQHSPKRRRNNDDKMMETVLKSLDEGSSLSPSSRPRPSYVGLQPETSGLSVATEESLDPKSEGSDFAPMTAKGKPPMPDHRKRLISQSTLKIEDPPTVRSVLHPNAKHSQSTDTSAALMPPPSRAPSIPASPGIATSALPTASTFDPNLTTQTPTEPTQTLHYGTKVSRLSSGRSSRRSSRGATPTATATASPTPPPTSTTTPTPTGTAARKTFPVPDLCKNSVLTYADEGAEWPDGKGKYGVRQVHSERKGEFREVEVLVGMRFLLVDGDFAGEVDE